MVIKYRTIWQPRGGRTSIKGLVLPPCPTFTESASWGVNVRAPAAKSQLPKNKRRTTTIIQIQFQLSTSNHTPFWLPEPRCSEVQLQLQRHPLLGLLLPPPPLLLRSSSQIRARRPERY
ncbi:ORF1327 [White spot syndrome virus]|uniref:ORF1327 n=1 Tax=White spot syndrome virus TaxID=342409 RepID=A0A2D3I5C0_9VIRU|nr:ORF1327 [White spot syndrome virus]